MLLRLVVLIIYYYFKLKINILLYTIYSITPYSLHFIVSRTLIFSMYILCDVLNVLVLLRILRRQMLFLSNLQH